MAEYKVGRGELSVSHLFFADDVLFFTSGKKRSLQNFMDILQRYSESSGQIINTRKSAFYIDESYNNRAEVITQITHIQRGAMPFVYLGVPISSGRLNVTHFDHILDKVRRTVDGWKAKVLLFGGRLTLIKSVLASYHIYTMACTPLPVTVLRNIERVLANFLWNIKGSSRTHWVSCEQVCLPLNEGGLGIGFIRDQMAALQAKLLWNVLANDSLWAQFARKKYFSGDKPVDTSQASPLWKALMKQYDTLQVDSQWILGDGKKRFWSDNWAGIILKGPRPTDENLTVADGLELLDEFWEHIPQQLHEKIRQISLDPTISDRRIYSPHEYGLFLTKIFKTRLRVAGASLSWPKLIWHKILPPDVACLLWKIKRHAVAVDKRVQTRGVVLVSSCRCSLLHQEETILHLFIQSEIARHVWTKFASLFELPTTYHSISHAMRVWLAGTSDKSTYGMARISIVAYIFKEIWGARCKATFENTPMTTHAIIKRVIYKTQTLLSGVRAKQRSSGRGLEVLRHIGIPETQIRYGRGTWLKWEPPPSSWYKLNVDGSALNGFTAGGGIIRDTNGHLIAAFAKYYGAGTNNSAELEALRDGIQLCRKLNIKPVLIESDSMVVVNAIRNSKLENWSLHYLFRTCHKLYTREFEIVHGLRQKNCVADRLARIAQQYQGQWEYNQIQDLPRVVCREYYADILGLHRYRN